MEEQSGRDFEASRQTLRDILRQRMPEPGSYSTPMAGLDLHRYHSGHAPRPNFYEPVVIVVVQGKKRVRIGTEDIAYGENSCFIAGINMPVASCVMEASEEQPYLSMSLKLDKTLIATLAASIPSLAQSTAPCPMRSAGATVQELDHALLDAFLRLLKLSDKSEEIPFLGPLVYQEIHYRLLTSPFGRQLRALNSLGSQAHQITRAISWLRENFTQSLHVEELAGRLHMAPSTFHKHFKEITTLSPVQYQKRLRLSEAQRLMLSDDCDVTQAALAVGYESATQFNREYKRLFGESPHRNVMNLKGMRGDRPHQRRAGI